MKLSEVPNLMPGCTVPVENPVRAMIDKKSKLNKKTALKLALRDKKYGNPAQDDTPDARSGGEDGGETWGAAVV